MTDIRQLHYRHRTDAGAADATPTWGASEDISFNPDAANFRLRLALRNAAGTATGSLPWQLYVSKNGGSYTAVTTSSTSGVKSVDAGSSADDTVILVPRLYPFSSDWQLSGAAIDLDFAGNRIYPSSSAFTDCLSCSRASIGYAKTSAGTLTQFGTDTLRITDLGMLVEDARTNYCTYSQSPGSNWSVGERLGITSFTDNQATVPDGTTTASSLIANTGSGNHAVYHSVSGATGAASWSCFFKASTYNYAVLGAVDGSDNRYSIIVNLTNGNITETHSTGTPAGPTSSVEAFADGWYRAQISLTAGDSSYVQIGPMNAATAGSWDAGTCMPNFTADGSGIFVWGIGTENGPFASSYIPTTTTSAARAADVVTCIGNLSTLWKAVTASTVFHVGLIPVVYPANNRELITFGFPSPVLSIHGDANNAVLAYNGSVQLDATYGGGTNYLTSDSHIGLARDGSGRSLVANAGTVASDANATPLQSTDPYIGTNTIAYLWTYVKRATFWNSRLADATLQGFTAP